MKSTGWVVAALGLFVVVAVGVAFASFAAVAAGGQWLYPQVPGDQPIFIGFVVGFFAGPLAGMAAASALVHWGRSRAIRAASSEDA